jgi:UDPglucose 6-dehydrogenase
MAAAADASALLVITEWREFRSPDFSALRAAMKLPLVLDGRNLYDPAHMKQMGFDYVGIGRADAVPRTSHAPMDMPALAA